MYILDRTSEDQFSFVACNPGQGLEYHSSKPEQTPVHAGKSNNNKKKKKKSNFENPYVEWFGSTGYFSACLQDYGLHPKLKYKTCLRLDGISKEDNFILLVLILKLFTWILTALSELCILDLSIYNGKLSFWNHIKL